MDLDYSFVIIEIESTALNALRTIATIYHGKEHLLPKFVTFSGGKDFYNKEYAQPYKDSNLFVRIYYHDSYFSVQYGESNLMYHDFSSMIEKIGGYVHFAHTYSKVTLYTHISLEEIYKQTVQLNEYINRLREEASVDLEGFRKRICHSEKHVDYIIE